MCEWPTPRACDILSDTYVSNLMVDSFIANAELDEYVAAASLFRPSLTLVSSACEQSCGQR